MNFINKIIYAFIVVIITMAGNSYAAYEHGGERLVMSFSQID